VANRAAVEKTAILEADAATRWRKVATGLGVLSLTLGAGLYIAMKSKLPF